MIGTPAYITKPIEKQKHFDSRAKKMYLVDYTDSPNVFMFYDPVSKQVVQQSNVTFLNESYKIKSNNSVICEKSESERINIELLH